MRRILSGLSVIAVFGVYAVGCSRGGEQTSEEQVTSVIVTQPAPRTIARTVSFSGRFAGSKEVMVYPPLPGKFSGYAVADGALVSQDQIVAQIDRDVPGVSYEPVPVKAPISGRFFSVGISPGEAVAPQMPVARISETSRLVLKFSIPEKYLASIREGSRARLTVPSLDYTTTAILSRVSRFVEGRSGTAQAEAAVPNPGGKLAPGMFAEVEVVVARKEASMAMPVDCVLGLEDEFVYVVEEGKAVKRNIRTGLEDAQYIEVFSGINESDSVIYVGQRIVEEGGQVEISEIYTPQGQQQ